MTATVLIPTHPTDTHAVAVALALGTKGARPLLWQTPDFPMRAGESLRFGGGGTTVEIRSPELELDPSQVTTVWNRRPSHGLDPDLLDPADLAFAERSLELLRRSVLSLLRPDAFWVNPSRAVEANTKPLQLAHALKAGFRVPETLVTNDPEAVRAKLSEGGYDTVTFIHSDDDTRPRCLEHVIGMPAEPVPARLHRRVCVALGPSRTPSLYPSGPTRTPEQGVVLQR